MVFDFLLDLIYFLIDCDLVLLYQYVAKLNYFSHLKSLIFHLSFCSFINYLNSKLMILYPQIFISFKFLNLYFSNLIYASYIFPSELINYINHIYFNIFQGKYHTYVKLFHAFFYIQNIWILFYKICIIKGLYYPNEYCNAYTFLLM